MTTTATILPFPMPEPLNQFPVSTLLLCGRIVDRGQLSAEQRAELDERAAQGQLHKQVRRRGDRLTVTYRVPRQVLGRTAA